LLCSCTVEGRASLQELYCKLKKDFEHEKRITALAVLCMTINYDTTITFFSIVQQSTSDAKTIYIYFSAINYTQPPVQLTGLLGV